MAVKAEPMVPHGVEEGACSEQRFAGQCATIANALCRHAFSVACRGEAERTLLAFVCSHGGRVSTDELWGLYDEQAWLGKAVGNLK